jgi:hypothetical protein
MKKKWLKIPDIENRIAHHNALFITLSETGVDKKTMNDLFGKKQTDSFLGGKVENLTTKEYIKMIGSFLFYKIQEAKK